VLRWITRLCLLLALGFFAPGEAAARIHLDARPNHSAEEKLAPGFFDSELAFSRLAAALQAAELQQAKSADGYDLTPGCSLAAESRALQFVKCFPPGTLVLMADGSTKPIEEIKEGDEVLAKDPASTDAPRSFKVAAQLQNSTEHLVTVEVQDAAGRVAHFKATREHPFWVKGLGWKNAVDLTDKDILADNSGSDVRVLSVKTEAEKSPTFNLTIDSKHTFYVVDNGVSVLVHNTGEELTTLYRGVWDTHPAFNQALLGNAAPRGGNIVSPYLHNMGNTNSIFTSWTTDAAVAAERAGAGGVILEGRFPASRLVASPNVAPSLIPEAEVLVLGKVTGAKVIPVGICP